MPSTNFYIGGNSGYSFTITSYFTAYTDYVSGIGLITTYSTPTTNQSTKTFPTSSIPAGSTINSAYITMVAGGSLYGGTEKQAGSSTQTNYNITGLITAGQDTNITYTFQSYTGGTGTVGGTTKSGTATFSNMVLVIDYTLPYTACGAPTTVSLSETTIDAGTTTTLSWSGASAGTNNAITAYKVYRSLNGGSYTLLDTITTSATSGSKTVSAHSTMGYYYSYKIITVGTHAGYDSGYSSVVSLTSKVYTACGAPTVGALPTTVDSGVELTLSWSGATAGTNNPIAGYLVYKRTATTGYSLAYDITSSLTYGSQAITITASNDTQYFFKVITKGTNANFNSANSNEVSTTILTYTNCVAPTQVNVSATLVESSLTLSWSGATAGRNNPIAHYQVSYQDSADNVVWGSIVEHTTTSSLSVSVEPNGTRGQYRRYLVSAIGTKAGYDSGYTQSAVVKKNQLAGAPTIVFPVNGTTIYNQNPYIKVSVGTEADSQKQSIKVENGGNTQETTATYNPLSTVNIQYGYSLSGSNSIVVKGNDGMADGAQASVSITVATPTFTDSTLAGTPIKAQHISELRAQIDNVRAYYGLSAYSWTDASLIAGVTPIKAQHIKDLQNALKECATLRGATLTFTTVGANARISGAHIQQVRDTITLV